MSLPPVPPDQPPSQPDQSQPDQPPRRRVPVAELTAAFVELRGAVERVG